MAAQLGYRSCLPQGDRVKEPTSGVLRKDQHSSSRQGKFRQAAFFYIHVAILYEAVVWVLHGEGSLPARGPVGVWLVAGCLVALFVFWGLWSWQNAWLARVVWAVGALRIPTLMRGAFLPQEETALSPMFYVAALIVVLINLWLLARAGWDL